MIYDLAIIGGGAAGYSAALEAVGYGLSVILFEKEYLGGTCLNRGCVPTKFLAHTAELLYESQKADRYGICFENARIDYSAAVEKMNAVVGELRENLTSLLLQKKIEIVEGNAQAADQNHILCSGEEYITKNLLIATGSVSVPSFFEGAETSDGILKLEEIPHSIKIIGGGVVAVEFASIFRKLGSQVTIAIRGDRILRKWDKELAVSLTQNFKKLGIKIQNKCSIEAFATGSYDVILSALGRVPNMEGIEFLDLEKDENGAIITDVLGRTSKDGVYAAGDVISGSPMLAHTGMEQGRRVACSIAGHNIAKASAVAECIYTDPEISSVGMTEAEAKEKELEVLVGKLNMRSNARTLIATNARSFIKVLADKKTHKIIGAQLMCKRANDIVSEFVVAINNGLTVEDIRASTHPHPSFSETVTDIMDSMIMKENEV